MRITAENLISAIGNLPTDREYQYVNLSNPGRIVIQRVQGPEGPIEFRRYKPLDGERRQDKPIETISTQMLWRLANSILPGKPINVDRIFGGSYNTRSVLEALIAHTPQYFSCKPGRIEQMSSNVRVKAGHKHLIYLPDEKPHENGKLGRVDVDIQISEMAVHDAVYQSVELQPEPAPNDMTIEQSRRHAQIQIALILIGEQLGFKTWVAANDRGIQYEGKRIEKMPTVVNRLESEQVLASYPDACRAARMIDCVWFKNGRMMPAVMEIEHSTGVTSGLSRMKGLYDFAPKLQNIRWAIVAPDDARRKVMSEANREQFRDMKTKFFPYSAVEELFSLCNRRKPKGITDEFLDCYMEECVTESYVH